MKLNDLKEAFDPKAHAQRKYQYLKNQFAEETSTWIVDGLMDHIHELQQHHEDPAEAQRVIQAVAPEWVKQEIDEALGEFEEAIMALVKEKAHEKGLPL
jgi:hypothetical protein